LIVIRERPVSEISAELLDRLRVIPPAVIGHLENFGFIDAALRPYGRRGFQMCGPAVTVRTAALDNGVVHKAIELAEPGDVLVIDRNGDRKHACWGEMTSIFAQERGIAMTVIDGPLTDIVEIEEMGYLVFASGIAPITTRSTGQTGEINTVIQCGGVPVAPGDIVLADDNGIVVLPPDHIAAIIDACEERVRREAMMRARLRAGESLPEITGANERIRRTLES
jgi:4-hydroxy-4-methyl-2-oxoglutarate aldolase